MAKRAFEIKINLGQRRKRIESAVFFKWLIHIGRVIVVLTELVALLALIYRFFLDMQIIDLHDQIKQERVFVKEREKKEEEYRRLQERLFQIASLPKATFEQVEIYQTIARKTEELGLIEATFQVGSDTVSIEGKSASVFTLSQYIGYLKGLERVEAISLGEVSRQQGAIKFSLRLELKGEEKKIEASPQKKEEEKTAL